jgi:phosphoglycolate phosphatase-like HAD superfamily hydrolase
MQSEFGIASAIDSVAVHGRTDRAITRDLFAVHGVADVPEHWDRFRAAYLRHLPQLLEQRQGLVLPGIVELLEQLRNRDDCAMGLLTGNTREGARIKLRHYGLDHFFDFGAYGDLHPERDDVARSALELIQRRFVGGLDLNRVWVIGDTPSDVRCGRAIGARCLAVATGNHTLAELAVAAPDHLAENLADHANLLNLLS